MICATVYTSSDLQIAGSLQCVSVAYNSKIIFGCNMHIPNHPDDSEKLIYTNHRQGFLTVFSVISFIGVFVSSYRFFGTDPVLAFFYPFLAFTTLYYAISLVTQGFGRRFDHAPHADLVRTWKPNARHSVDIFLPTCGEELDVIKNTWDGVKRLRETYRGSVAVYNLDDSNDPRLKEMAEKYGFNYLVREDQGHFKKSGNLRHGFKNSKSEFIAIFDADFRPRPDFLDELLPYFDRHSKLGIVQSPQYFDVCKSQNWLERGAGAVQEYFYRSVQQNRQLCGGAICVGSNAIYRRAALADNGGTTLIEHSEDVHTGFDLKNLGWELMYVPIVLAKGVCPNELSSFFRQQYRWCSGSMSLLGSNKFWSANLTFLARLCFFSGFFYYIHTAIFSVVAPLVPIALLFIVPEQALLSNYLMLIPALLYTHLIFPSWHTARYGGEALAVKMAYGWAHLFALVDSLRQGVSEWHPTGSTSNKSIQFNVFKLVLACFSFPVALLWVGASVWYMVHWNIFNFLPVFLSGLLYLWTVSKVASAAFFPQTLRGSPVTAKKTSAIFGGIFR